ncbi:MAG: hypothetical protein AAGJ18_31315, partial [Bacteroidota bacterium]
NDCMVYCLIELPAEYTTALYTRVLTCPENFQISLDRKYCHRTISIINENERTEKLGIRDLDFPDREVEINNFTIIDCEN